MITSQEIQDRRKEIAELRHAESVFRDITARLNERENYEKRWFWELLQNAKDSTDANLKSVKVKIEISDKVISFSHSGLPFDLDDILSLIIQGSSKADKKGKTGRFGTGFMTTYLLSKKVIIAGKLTNNRGCFQFLLNRDAESNEEFFQLQNQSNIEFENSIQEESYLGDSEFQTKFTYQLDQLGDQTAKAGLLCLDELIPVTQLFNEQIESVVVEENNSSKTFTKKKLSPDGLSKQAIAGWEIATLINDVIQSKYNAYTLKAEETESCVITAFENGHERIIPFSNNYPRLYFTFPLIGTEEIGIPIIINSELFKPRIERDGIYLKSTEENDNGDINKDILEKSFKQTLALYCEFFSTRNVHGLFELFNIKQGKSFTWIDEAWFRKIKKQAIENLLTLKVLSCERKTEFVSLSEMKIPFLQCSERAKDLWKLLSLCRDFNVPLQNEIENWKYIIQSFTEIEASDYSPYKFKFVWGIEKLIDFVSENNSVEDLKSRLVTPLKEWVDCFYELVTQVQGGFPLDKKIFINQEGALRKCEGMLWDQVKDKELTALSDVLKLHFGRRLIADFVNPFHIPGIGDFKRDSAIGELKSKLNELTNEQLTLIENLQCSARFLKWLIVNKNDEAIKDLKIITGADKDEKFNLERFRTGEHLFLTPKTFFCNLYPLYSELIRDRDCLNDVYNSYLSEEDFSWLDTKGLVFKYPLIVKKEIANAKTIELLIADEKDLSLLKDKDGQYIHRPTLTYTDFAYLTANDGHIFDRNKTARSSFERFKFLLEEAVEKDSFLQNETQESLIEGVEKAIRFNTCVWVARAKRLQWVNFKTETSNSETKFASETPSSKNLSELLKFDESLVKKIRGSKQQLLLQKLGVGVSDLLRNSLTSEELKLSWDKAITNMITSDADPKLVEEIFSNVNIQSEYEKMLQQKRLIKRNQDIGFWVEQLFKQYILQLKSEGYNVSIERKPFGSDYIVTDESSDLVNDKNQLELFEVNGWLIELKATGKSYAAMTELQAHTASKNKDQYALVVVELDGSELDIEYVKSKAVVIDRIGEKIEKVIPDFEDVRLKKNKLNIGQEGVSVDIEENGVRFRVESKIWHESKMSIFEFVSSKFKLRTTEIPESA